jgi:hypothetical protein
MMSHVTSAAQLLKRPHPSAEDVYTLQHEIDFRLLSKQHGE